MDDLLAEFLTETGECMDTLDVELVKLEQNPNDKGILGNIFRLVHTVKGTCGFLGLPRLESIAHASENVLGKVRDGELTVTPEAISLILQSLDLIKAICSELERTEQEPAGDDAALIDLLNVLAKGGGAPAAGPASTEAAGAEAESAPASAAGGAEFPVAAELVAEYEAAQDTGPDAPEDAGTQVVIEEAVAEAPPAAVASPAESAAPAPAKPSGDSPSSSIATQSIRVGVDVLESLMTMVSELVLTRNQLMQLQRSSDEDDVFAAPLQTLNHIVSELQEGVMQTRMQPIGNAWSKLPRIIRDLSLELGKKIELQMHGQETELDRQVLELIRDPLTHMVRNSADHGLETPKDRLAAGKSAIGTVVLEAFHEGGHIIIQIKDDGRGINAAKVKQKIIANGLSTEAEVEGMSDSQVYQYVFKAGFSTAEKVTSVSGRGVGMDVVRTNIEKIGGTVELQSVEGKGATFTIKIPLTLAIVSALVVESAGERFAIPQISVLELVRASNTSENRIEDINGAQVLRLRDRLLPLVSLSGLLQLGDQDAAAATATEQDIANAFIVVTQVGANTFGIIVDRVFDTEEIVVKPVAPILRDIQMFSGNTILGDGSVIMILDPNGTASAASGDMSDSAADEISDTRDQRGDDEIAILLFGIGTGSPKAVPLELIARLEEFDVNTIEISDGRRVVQYRGQLMPLITLQPDQTLREEGRQPVLVFADQDRSMGIMVDEIIDIVETRLSVEIASQVPGYLGSAVIAGKATDVIDAGHFLTQAAPDWFKGHGDEAFGEDGNSRVLLVDDSPFFRNMLSPLLEIAGYRVTAAESASAALKLCEEGKDFDIIISDIEMPEMNGFEFAEKIKSESRWKEVPIVALSSHTAPRDLDRGREVGFSDYVRKFDRDSLLESLEQALSVTRSAA